MNDLFGLAQQHGLRLNRLVEVGVHNPSDCQFREFILHATCKSILLVEPSSDCCVAINKEFEHYGAVRVINCAIHREEGTRKLYDRSASSFLEGTISPAIVNDGAIESECEYSLVRCIRFDRIDDGQIDAVAADVEGCEFFILEAMVSRPKLIVLETHGGRAYVNPFLREIEQWMATNGYTMIARDESDTAWILSTAIGQAASTTKSIQRPSRSECRLSLCMIVRDSSRTLPAALQSIRAYVDEMVVVDTGSSDNTPSIAEQLGARVFHFPWCDDFSAARNESLRFARGEWLFWMDSDDTIDAANGQKLRDLANVDHDQSILGFVMQVHCPGPGQDGENDVTVVDHVKLIRNRPDLRFDGRIHEQILPAIRRAGGDVAWTDIFVVHSGFDHSPAAQERKRARDLGLLHMELAERPDHPFTLFNLGMTYTDMESFDQAAEYLFRSISVSPVTDSHLRKAYALLVYSYRMLGRIADAWERCEEGLKLFPNDAELRFRSGVLLHEMGRLEEAVQAYRQAMRADDNRQFASYDVGIKGFKARHNLAITLAELGDLQSAEIQWREIVRERPGYRVGWRGLAENLVKQQKLTTAAVLAERLENDACVAPEGALLRALIHEVHGNAEAACLDLERALESYPDDREMLGRICRLSFLHREPVQAEPYLKRFLALDPEDPAAHHNLGTLYLRMARNCEAAEYFGNSIKLRPNSADTWVSLGYAVAAVGNQDDAVASWHHALELAPGHPGANTALEQFESRRQTRPA